MKKLILIVLAFMYFNVNAQELAWDRDFDTEDFFYSWDLDVQVWTATDIEGDTTINIEDVISENWFGVRNTLSTVIYSILDEAEYNDQTIEDLEFDMLVYSWFESDDPTNEFAKYENEDERWDIYINREWLSEYFSAKRDKDKTFMVDNLVNSKVVQWEELNKDVLKRDVEDIDESIIIEQEELELDSINLRPKPKK